MPLYFFASLEYVEFDVIVVIGRVRDNLSSTTTGTGGCGKRGRRRLLLV